MNSLTMNSSTKSVTKAEKDRTWSPPVLKKTSVRETYSGSINYDQELYTINLRPVTHS